MDSPSVLRGILILFAAGVLIYLAMEYYKKDNLQKDEEGFETEDEVDGDDDEIDNGMMEGASLPSSVAKPKDPAFMKTVSSSKQAKPNEPSSNEDYKPVNFESKKLPKDCFPKDKLTAEDLLPKDAANSKWAKVNPAGQGDVKDQNFLNAGYHVGVNTVGNSLRNPNMQLRSEPPNPHVKVSPWNQTTIESDLNRRPLEIGGCE
jgi:hypothetical protein